MLKRSELAAHNLDRFWWQVCLQQLVGAPQDKVVRHRLHAPRVGSQSPFTHCTSYTRIRFHHTYCLSLIRVVLAATPPPPQSSKGHTHSKSVQSRHRRRFSAKSSIYRQSSTSKRTKTTRVQSSSAKTFSATPGAKTSMGWLRVGALKLQVSFVEYLLFYRALLQNRHIILRRLLTKPPHSAKSLQ